MAEENQVTNTEEHQVTTKKPKKVEVGRRLAEYNHRKREELKAQIREGQKSEVLTSSMCYSIGALLVMGVIGDLGYYLYQTKVNAMPPQQPSHPHPEANKFEME